jgi:hypothetical protein
MAVSITTKFYQDSAWKDLSKVVFTSPNLDSPSSAGTRSHILPGQGNLGLWYEDSSNMYRIESSQSSTSTSFYNYISTTTSEIDLDTPSASVTVTGTEAYYEAFFEYVKDSVGCTAIGYTSLDMSSVVQDTRIKLQYTASGTSWDDKGHIPNVYETDTDNSTGSIDIYGLTTTMESGDTRNKAWVVDQISGLEECYIDIDLDKPYKITKIYMKGEYAYDDSESTYFHKRFFGNYKVLGKIDLNDDWLEIYDGSNTSNLETSIFLTSNTNFFKYYRILIENNTGLSGFNTSYYAISALQFYTFDYNNTPTRTKPFYNFKENGDADVVYVSDISTTSGIEHSLTVDSATGSGTISTGTEIYGWGAITGTVDYQMDDSVVFEITSGEAYDCRLTAWDDATHSTTSNELIDGDHVRVSALAFCCSNSKLSPGENYDPINYVWGPVQNRIFKGNSTDTGTNLFYGDFDLVYRYQTGVYGDFLIFKPMLYGIDDSLSYGVHDFLITLTYSYT